MADASMDASLGPCQTATTKVQRLEMLREIGADFEVLITPFLNHTIVPPSDSKSLIDIAHAALIFLQPALFSCV